MADIHEVLGEPTSEDTDAHTADEFAAFFKDKVESVRASTMSTPAYDVPCTQVDADFGEVDAGDH